ALLLLVALPLAPGVFKLLQPGGLGSADLEASRAADQLQDELGYNPASIVVVFTSDHLRNDDPRWIAAEQDALADIRRLPHVRTVPSRQETARQVALDGKASYVSIALASEADRLRAETLARVRAALRPTELDYVVTGAQVYYSDILAVTEADLRRAELISLPF